MKKKGSNKTVTQIREELMVDYDSGELKKENTVYVRRAEAEPNYIKLYVDDISSLKDLRPKTGSLMFELLQMMPYDNLIVLNKFLKEKIAKNINSSLQTVNEGIAILIRKEIILRKARGTFLMNPKYFGRGSWQDIKSLRLSIEYDFMKGTKKMEVEKNVSQ